MMYHFKTLHKALISLRGNSVKSEFVVTFVTFVKIGIKALTVSRKRMLHFYFFKFKNVTIVTDSGFAGSAKILIWLQKFCNRFCNRFCNMVTLCISEGCYRCYKNNRVFRISFENGLPFSQNLKILHGHG